MAAAASGRLDVLHHLARTVPCTGWDAGVVAAAAGGGYIAVTRWLLEAGAPCNDAEVAAAAARGGRVEILRCLRAAGRALGPPALRAALLAEQLDVADWLCADGGCGVVSNTSGGGEAVSSGGCCFDAVGIAAVQRAAGESGKLCALAWLKAQGVPLAAEAAVGAAASGLVDALQYLRREGAPLTAAAMEAAAAAGHLPPMEFLRRAGCPMEVRAALAAAGAKRGAALRYLLRSGCPVDATVFARCVAWGERPVISMLLDAGCSCDADAAAAAAGRNDLSLLMYLVNTAGAPMDERVCSESMGHPDGAVLRLWAHANGLACKGCACRQPLSSSSLYPWKHGASSKVPRNKQQPLVAVRS
ncbi:unnamed protein product [Phaeothamnion confervicola]